MLALLHQRSLRSAGGPGAVTDVAAVPDAVLDALRGTVGDRHVLVDPGVTAGYAVDWTGRFRGYAPAVVRPGSSEEVAAIVRVCAEAGVALVPQGGNTGLVGGGVPLHGEVVLSLARLDALGAGGRGRRPGHGRGRRDARPAPGARGRRRTWPSASTSRRATAARSAG